ncbi:MAG: hypothetical protein H6729_08645 [Deltaproteobacteria bacterium]|nr:hypothetical protein [Deltaproteobacteria bacterium]
MTDKKYLAGALRNVARTKALFDSGEPPALIGTVCGSAEARDFWQQAMEEAKHRLRAKTAVSFHEDLPVNQAFGVLLLWQRLRGLFEPGQGALVAFVFGEGSRATPFTEADLGQKPAMASYVASFPSSSPSSSSSSSSPADVATPILSGRRYLPMVELALQYFAPVEAYLRRSGFDGIVVKWGDEVQIPTKDLEGQDPRFKQADVVRFVSMQRLTDESARAKDWVGVNAAGEVTAFIPRRPLADMEHLADRGLLQRRDGALFGGVNLGSIALSRVFLDALLDEFSREVNDPSADRRSRPDLDPQLFTALTVATIAAPEARAEAWAVVTSESAAMRSLAMNMPDVLDRLRRVLDVFASTHGRPVSMMALDFEDQFWGDVGQHRQIYEFFMTLRAPTEVGRVARAIAGIQDAGCMFDARGNVVVGDSKISPQIQVENSVLIDVELTGQGVIRNSVLIGTQAHDITSDDAFDVLSTIPSLRLHSRGGTYKVVRDEPLEVAPGERWTTVFLPAGEVHLRVEEDTDLRDRATHYDRPILNNVVAFQEAHTIMSHASRDQVESRREVRRAEILRRMPPKHGK